MNKLYLITGPCGIGKSTISKELAFNLEKSVLIEGDDIYHQVVGSYHSPWHELNHLDTFWKVCLNMINTYLENGYDVVFNYIITKDKFNQIKQEVKTKDIKLTVLLSSLETLLSRDKLRDEDSRMNERCKILLDNFISYNYDEEYILYTDNLSIKETVNTILNKGESHE